MANPLKIFLLAIVNNYLTMQNGYCSCDSKLQWFAISLYKSYF